MTTATANRPINAFTGIAGNLVLPPVLTAQPGGGLAASAKLYSGVMIGWDASGNLVDAGTAACVTVGGLSRALYDNSGASAVPPTSGLAGAINGEVLVGPYSVLNDGTISTATAYGTDLYLVDNQTVSVTDTSATGAARLRAGFFVAVDPSNTTGAVICQFGVASPSGRAFGGSSGFATPQNKARFVFTSLGANTGTGTGQLTITATGALAAQDGVTPAVGDVCFIQEGTTNLAAAKDAGPYVITNPGATGVSPVLTRPDWWANGSTILPASVIQLGGEGTLWAGTEWKSFVAKAKVVGTDAPLFWVGRVSQTVTLVSSTATVSNVGIRSATATLVEAQFVSAAGTTTNTIGYGIIAAPTAGAIGTASAVIDALASGMGKNGSSDASVLMVTIINW